LDSVPGAWTTLLGDPVKLFSPVVESAEHNRVRPGTVLSSDEAGDLTVACGKGALRVGEIQSSGKKRMPVSEWLKGNRLPGEASFE
jgi:methionyl-tRNA formyltransferase